MDPIIEHYRGTATLRLTEKIRDLHEHRKHAFGGEGTMPYFFITNDLCNKTMLFIMECGRRSVPLSSSEARFLVHTLLSSYDDPHPPTSCWFYHSVPKATALKLVAFIEKHFPV